MRILAMVTALLLAGCGSRGELELPWMTSQAHANVGPAGGLAQLSLTQAPGAAGVTPAEFRAAYCELSQRGHGMPIRLDPGLRKELVDAWGKEKAAKFLRPVARSNKAVNCFCAEPAARAKMQCS